MRQRIGASIATLLNLMPELLGKRCRDLAPLDLDIEQAADRVLFGRRQEHPSRGRIRKPQGAAQTNDQRVVLQSVSLGDNHRPLVAVNRK